MLPHGLGKATAGPDMHTRKTLANLGTSCRMAELKQWYFKSTLKAQDSLRVAHGWLELYYWYGESGIVIDYWTQVRNKANHISLLYFQSKSTDRTKFLWPRKWDSNFYMTRGYPESYYLRHMCAFILLHAFMIISSVETSPYEPDGAVQTCFTMVNIKVTIEYVNVLPDFITQQSLGVGEL